MDTIFPSPPGDGTAILRGQAVAGQRKVPPYDSYEDYFQVFRGFSKKSYPEMQRSARDFEHPETHDEEHTRTCACVVCFGLD